MLLMNEYNRYNWEPNIYEIGREDIIKKSFIGPWSMIIMKMRSPDLCKQVWNNI
jgi:hypothetical protein